MEINKNWFLEQNGFFGPRYFGEYDEPINSNRTHDEVTFLEEILHLKNEDKILDVPCGHGRHSNELARRGFNVCGIEHNNFFIETASHNAQELGLTVKYVQGDMRHFSMKVKFDVAINLFTSFGYFEHDEDDQSFFNAVSRSLKRDGKFLVDFVNQTWLVRNFKAKDWRYLGDEKILLVERMYQSNLGKNLVTRKYISENKIIETSTTSIRLYTPTEIINMAKISGMGLEASYGGFDQSALSIDSERAILLFKKY